MSRPPVFTDADLLSVDRERFWSRVEKGSNPSDCWNWVGRLTRGGYGAVCIPGGTASTAHRVSFVLAGNSIDGRLEWHVDHLCRNRRCVNPAHLELVTPGVNVLRGESPWGQNSRKTHCLRGHEYTAENTLPQKGGKHRQCRTCRRARAKEETRRRLLARRAQRAQRAGGVTSEG